MWSAMIGDIIGSTFEVENHRSPFFELFRKDARFTDDTVCTVAVADILNSMSSMPEKKSDFTYYLDNDWVSNKMRIWCCSYLNRGFGSMFYQWLTNGINQPYRSYGNGALMRISPVPLYGVKNGWDIKKTKEIALDITNITHNHKDAKNAITCYVDILYCLLKDRFTIEKAKEEIIKKLTSYGYEAPKKVEEYRLSLEFDLTCTTSLLVACAGVLEANSYEEVFSWVVSMGGDTDTYCAIAGPIAEAIWGLDSLYLELIKPYFRNYDNELLSVMEEMYK
jgi:ADP-ribosylglycohydrolase